jgi:hypothetical protein
MQLIPTDSVIHCHLCDTVENTSIGRSRLYRNALYLTPKLCSSAAGPSGSDFRSACNFCACSIPTRYTYFDPITYFLTNAIVVVQPPFEDCPLGGVDWGASTAPPLDTCILNCKSNPVTGLEWPRGFQEIKVPRFHDNGTGWW